jgi:hypothetical protein
VFEGVLLKFCRILPASVRLVMTTLARELHSFPTRSSVDPVVPCAQSRVPTQASDISATQISPVTAAQGRMRPV